MIVRDHRRTYARGRVYYDAAVTRVSKKPSTDVDRGRARVFLLVRFTLIIATSYLILAELDFRALPLLLVALIALGLLSNVAALFAPRRWLDSTPLTAAVIVGDTLWITAALVVSGRFQADFFYLYFFVLFLAGIGENLRLIILGSVVVCAAYIFVLMRTGGSSVALSTASLVRIPFLFAVALFYGYLVDRLRSEQQRGRTEREAVARLEENRHVLASANLELEHEVAERVRAERELRKFSRAVEQSPDAVLMLDTDGVVEWVNSRLEPLTGVAEERVLGHPMEALGLAGVPLETLEELRSAITGRCEWRSEFRVTNADEMPRWISASLAPVQDPGGVVTHLVLLARDFTDRKQAEETLRRANDELKTLNDMKSALVSTVSHELRTPLTALKNAVDLLRRGLGDAPTELQTRFMDMALRNVHRLKLIIDDLLDLARIEAGRMEFRFEGTDPHAIIEETVTMFQAQAETAGIALVSGLPPALPSVWADAKRVGQVLANLLSNALKFTPRGGRVTVTARILGPDLEVSVTDTGPGLARGEQQRIFEPFYQAGDSLTRKEKGSGLGLAISQDLVHAHGGEFGVESTPGQGARFFFTLPSHTAQAEESTAFEEEVRRQRSFPFFSLLLVEPAEPAPTDLSREAVLAAVHDRIRDLLPRNMDKVIPLGALNRIAVILPSTARDGGIIVRRKLSRALESDPIHVGDTSLPQPHILGPGTYPDDGDTGRELIDMAEQAR